MRRRVAITGATGRKSGGQFARLVSENIEAIQAMFPDGIRALVRPMADIAMLQSLIPSIEICRGDCTDVEFLKKSLSDVDTLVHIAGIHFSREVVDAATHSGVRRLIMIHTTGIYSRYKAAGEEYRLIDDYVYTRCRENDITLTICRPTMIYGNIHDGNIITFISMVDRLPLMPVVNGARYALQPVHYADLAHAYLAILFNEAVTANKDYILSGHSPILLRDILTLIGEKLGKRVRFINCPFPIAYAGAWMVYCLTLGKKDFREKVQRLCEPRIYPHDDARQDFGYSPTPFETGITAEIQQYLGSKQSDI